MESFQIRYGAFFPQRRLKFNNVTTNIFNTAKIELLAGITLNLFEYFFIQIRNLNSRVINF